MLSNFASLDRASVQPSLLNSTMHGTSIRMGSKTR